MSSAEKTYQEIANFRKANKECVSTSHTFDFVQALNVLPLIHLNHKDWRLSVYNGQVKITIVK